MLGPWDSQGKAEEAVSALDGLRAVIPDIQYAKGSGILDGTDDEMNAAITLARNADVTIAILGESADMSGEASSRHRSICQDINRSCSRRSSVREAVISGRDRHGRPDITTRITGLSLATIALEQLLLMFLADRAMNATTLRRTYRPIRRGFAIVTSALRARVIAAFHLVIGSVENSLPFAY